jgi:hypothetical protein
VRAFFRASLKLFSQRMDGPAAASADGAGVGAAASEGASASGAARKRDANKASRRQERVRMVPTLAPGDRASDSYDSRH